MRLVRQIVRLEEQKVVGRKTRKTFFSHCLQPSCKVQRVTSQCVMCVFDVWALRGCLLKNGAN